MLAPRPNERRVSTLLAAAALGTLAAFPRPATADAPVAAVSAAEARLRADVGYLADDLREGRAPGTRGIDAAADHIAGVFRELGLKPAPGAEGYFQPFTIRGSASLEGPRSIGFHAKDIPEIAVGADDFSPLALGSTAEVSEATVVFAGYGITAKDAKAGLDYDDYDKLEVKDKVVLIFRREPQQEDARSPFDGKAMTEHSDLRTKATNAFQHGARAILLVNDSVTARERDLLVPFNFAGGEQSTPIPFTMISRAVAAKLLAAAGSPTLDELERGIDSDLKPRSRLLDGLTVDSKYTVERKGLVAKNVVAVLEGSGPLADETIVVGGHYDHLGKGGFFSGSLAPLSSDIHNGADDNASGTAMVLEMARRLARRTDPLPRRVVFMAFSGEEKGLLGSRYYVNNPLYPLAKTAFMVNFDMVGRLNERSELTVFGTGSAAGLTELVQALGASEGFKVKAIASMSEGIGGSDHESFYLKGVPVLFAFTGTHTDYHRPSDDTDRINFPGMARIADFGELVLLDIVRRPRRPEFLRARPQVAAHGEDPKPLAASPSEPKAPASAAHGTMADPADPTAKDIARVGISAYLGSIPDYDEGTSGVKLSGVGPGTPAEKAGLKSGDTVVGFAGKPIATIYDYTQGLARAKPGDEVEIKVLRDGKEVSLKATLGARPRGN